MMVAPREERTTQPPDSTPSSEDSPFSRYSVPIDLDSARADPATGTIHLFSFHESFQRRPRLRPAERKELLIKQGALRIAAGMEMRSLRVLAKEIGCSHTALDNAVARLCDRIGIRKFHVSDLTRRKQRDARRRQLASR